MTTRRSFLAQLAGVGTVATLAPVAVLAAQDRAGGPVAPCKASDVAPSIDAAVAGFLTRYPSLRDRLGVDTLVDAFAADGIRVKLGWWTLPDVAGLAVERWGATPRPVESLAVSDHHDPTRVLLAGWAMLRVYRHPSGYSWIYTAPHETGDAQAVAADAFAVAAFVAWRCAWFAARRPARRA